METILLVLYTLAICLILVRSDRDAARLSAVTVDGKPLEGWLIVDARSASNRRIGLLNHAFLPMGTGLLLRRSRTVHTVGMLFPIDLAFIDKRGVVLSTRAAVQPGERRITGPRGTKMVLELPAGSLESAFPITDQAALSFQSRD